MRWFKEAKLTHRYETANRRLAIDAAEADEDEPGAMSQIKGLKLAFTDIKTYILAVAYVSQEKTCPDGAQN